MFFSKTLISALSVALVATAAPTTSETQSVNVEARGELVARTTGTFTWYLSPPSTSYFFYSY